MREAVGKAWEAYVQFKGDGMHLGLYFAAVLSLGMFGGTRWEKENSYRLSGYSLLFWGVFFFPVTAKIIMDYCIGSGVYWRMLWILPFPLVIAYAFTISVKRVHSGWKRQALVFCMAMVIMGMGAPVYTQQNFGKADNLYKIPQSAIDVCQIINEDAGENHIEGKKAIATNELLSFIRQYDGSIEMPYGRNAPKEGRFQNKNSKRIFKLMSSQETDFQKLLKYAKKEKCNYLVYYIDGTADEALRNLGWKVVGSSEQYRVYRLDGWEISQ